MVLGRRSAVWMALSLLLLVAAFQMRERQLRPMEMRARAARWALTTGWMLERYHQQHGVYPACGGGKPPCVRYLGWMAAPYRLKGYQVQARPVTGGYRVEAIGTRGRWVLERAQPIRWEGEPFPSERPGWLDMGWLRSGG